MTEKPHEGGALITKEPLEGVCTLHSKSHMKVCVLMIEKPHEGFAIVTGEPHEQVYNRDSKAT